MSEERPTGWRAAMAQALYGPRGFYRDAGAPARHFRTAAHATTLWADAIAMLAGRVHAAMGGPEGFAIVDIGAGGGELLDRLAVSVPADWSLTGVDVAPRPSSLPDRVHWRTDPPDDVVGLILAVELLDVVALDIAVMTGAGPRLLSVAASGDETVGDPVTGPDAAWLERWWPRPAIGDRMEIGRGRDEVWHALTARLGRGVAVAIDYAAEPTRDAAGTMTAYRAGRQVAARPDGCSDLTAHVRFDSLAAPGDRVISQRDALEALGVQVDRPRYDGSPTAYLAGLERAGGVAELLDRSGLGGFTWLLHCKGVAAPV